MNLSRAALGWRTVALPPRGQNPLVQLEAPGLYYAYRVDGPRYPGRVDLVPFSTLPLP